MPFALFQSKPPLDEASIEWLFAYFQWALQHADARVFRERTLLVTPTNEHYPGRENSVHGMAKLIFERTLGYAGMSHWPLRLAEPLGAQLVAPPQVKIPGALRGPEGAAADKTAAPIPIAYDARMLNDPEAMIAGYAQALSHYLMQAIGEEPPGGMENWPHGCEVMGVFLGFGVMFANTAFRFKGSSCGSCAGPVVERQVFLSQFDITYALALFCTLKGIPARAALKHLKSPLKSHFKQCMRDIAGRTEALAPLQALA